MRRGRKAGIRPVSVISDGNSKAPLARGSGQIQRHWRAARQPRGGDVTAQNTMKLPLGTGLFSVQEVRVLSSIDLNLVASDSWEDETIRKYLAAGSCGLAATESC
jgi:hypothetical protein